MPVITAIRSDLALDRAAARRGLLTSRGVLCDAEGTRSRALLVAFNLDEQELGKALAPSPEEGVPFRVALYEMAVGGSGVLACWRSRKGLPR